MSDTLRDYPIVAMPLTQVAIDDAFWKPRIDTAINVTLPHNFRKCEETGRIDNFAKAGGLMAGAHQGIFYDDSDVFKVVEGAAYALQIAPDPEREACLDDLIDKFAAAQEDDGYLYTARSIDPAQVDPRCGPERWSNLAVNHELYNVGHMYEAAVAYHAATGKRKFLDVAIRSADLIDAVFGAGKLRDVPGHQEIEIGLVRLYRATGDEKYLRLAKFFLDERGQSGGRQLYGAYCQDHLPVTRQDEAVGHAVRAVYMYAGMTDIAAISGDDAYLAAVQALWDNVVGKKLALTGGIGARHDGEAFGADYELPNLRAYNETCAALASVLWNQRLFLLTGESRFIDVLERTLYNGFLSGVGMDGKTFFYVNPLACDGDFRFNLGKAMSRQPWYETSCCPTNVARLLPSLPGYIYAARDQELYVNLYIASRAAFQIAGVDVQVQLASDYPWDGLIQLDVRAAQPVDFTLCLRIPSFARGQPLPGDLYRYLENETASPTLSIDGVECPLDIRQGYARLSRRWAGGSRVELRLPMAIRRVVAHESVAELAGKTALERGPIVYALEQIDNQASALDLALADDSPLDVERRPDLLGGIHMITGRALDRGSQEQDFQAIPYYAWGHRGEGRMSVWLNRA